MQQAPAQAGGTPNILIQPEMATFPSFTKQANLPLPLNLSIFPSHCLVSSVQESKERFYTSLDDYEPSGVKSCHASSRSLDSG